MRERNFVQLKNGKCIFVLVQLGVGFYDVKWPAIYSRNLNNEFAPMHKQVHKLFPQFQLKWGSLTSNPWCYYRAELWTYSDTNRWSTYNSTFSPSLQQEEKVKVKVKSVAKQPAPRGGTCRNIIIIWIIFPPRTVCLFMQTFNSFVLNFIMLVQ